MNRRTVLATLGLSIVGLSGCSDSENSLTGGGNGNSACEAPEGSDDLEAMLPGDTLEGDYADWEYAESQSASNDGEFNQWAQRTYARSAFEDVALAVTTGDPPPEDESDVQGPLQSMQFQMVKGYVIAGDYGFIAGAYDDLVEEQGEEIIGELLAMIPALDETCAETYEIIEEE